MGKKQDEAGAKLQLQPKIETVYGYTLNERKSRLVGLWRGCPIFEALRAKP
jgi:hypothetical protein